MRKAALVVIDMVKDNLANPEHNLVAREAEAIIPVINVLAADFRQADWPVIYASDSFLEGDFIFGGKMVPHAIRGTAGAEVTDALSREAGDIILPKRRFSAFFKTDLDQTLRTLKVDTVVVCGIISTFCVLATALDALCHDFKTIIVEDASCAHKAEVHQTLLGFYRHNPLYPLFQISPAAEVFERINRD
ncbi:MAG: isochorismatase family cysteine hydrolase [Pseudomonadota bacterium]|nr:isochorismatase family cysteine hydrolase [Pseudomonadota bacterium]